MLYKKLIGELWRIMRIIGGTASGIPISAPPGQTTRPTGDRVREALFNTLATYVAGARVLDLYAGSGALGLEALSRGAATVCWVERQARAAQVIRENLVRTHLPTENSRLLVMDAALACRRLIKEQRMFDVILCDPPWHQGVAFAVLEQLPALVTPEAGVVVIEAERGRQPPGVPGLSAPRVRNYGRTALYYFEAREMRA